MAESPVDEALALPVRDDGLPTPGEVESSAQRTNPPKLTSAKAGDNIKLRDEILLQKIENPSEDDMGKAIQIGSNVLILGQVDEDTKNIFRNKFIENYGSSVDVSTVSQEKEVSEEEIDTFVLPTQEQIDELAVQPKALIKQAITRYNEINEGLSGFENIEEDPMAKISGSSAFADEKTKISELSKTDSAGGELDLGARSRVANVERYFMEEFGIKVQISNADDTKLADNSMTLTQAGKL